jgi:hypothetical protein
VDLGGVNLAEISINRHQALGNRSLIFGIFQCLKALYTKKIGHQVPGVSQCLMPNAFDPN